MPHTEFLQLIGYAVEALLIVAALLGVVFRKPLVVKVARVLLEALTKLVADTTTTPEAGASGLDGLDAPVPPRTPKQQSMALFALSMQRFDSLEARLSQRLAAIEQAIGRKPDYEAIGRIIQEHDERCARVRAAEAAH